MPKTVFLIYSQLLSVSIQKQMGEAFKMTQFSPKSGSITIKEGDDLELSGKSDDAWEWCTIIHQITSKSCKYVRNKPLDDVKELNCNDFADRQEYISTSGQIHAA